jgi:uncharacterized protein YbaR (Trm112 family)
LRKIGTASEPVLTTIIGGIMAISKELLDILACPKCKGDIHLNEAGDGLICDKCRLLYEIKDDIPIMLIDEAKPLP